MSRETEEELKKTVGTEFLEPGAVLSGRYRIEHLIGNGGMAAVYLVTDTTDNSQCALKLLHREHSSDKTYVERFVREVRMMHKVNHPNVVKTFDIGTDGALVYFTMEYIDGTSLEHLLDSETLSVGEMSWITVGICAGLSAIHQRDIVHRDLKPGNVLISSKGEIKIADFGIAREKEATRLTTKTQKVGSLCYMAPEIWLGKELSAAVDVYSLGVVLYELATGEVPFEDDFPGSIMQMHLDDAVTAPREIDPRVPAWLSDLIVRMLEKNPRKRPASMVEIERTIREKFSDLALANECLSLQGKIAGFVLAEEKRKQSFTKTEITSNNYSAAENAVRAKPRRGKTYVFSLTATKVLEESTLTTPTRPRRKATVIIPLPRHAAFVFEIETPSRDFLYFGVFLGSLQVFDGILTSAGMKRFTLQSEGNPLLRYLMTHYGTDVTLVVVKALAVLMVVALTVLAKRQRWIKDMIKVLSCFYLFAAIVPWVYLLFL